MLIIFLTISYVINIGIIFLMKKDISNQEIISTCCFVSLNTIVADLYLGEILDLYDLMKAGPQVSDMLVELTLPATFGIIYVYFMPKEKSKFLLYLIFWVVFSVIYEQITRYLGYVIYKGWNVWYSALFYIYACLFMRWYYLFMKKETK